VQSKLDILKVTKTERFILMNLSVLPSVYIPAKDIIEWLGLDTKEDIDSLINKEWLVQNPETKIYIHPMTRVLVRKKTRPRVKTCKKLIDSLIDKLYLKPEENPLNKKGFVDFAEEVLCHILEKDIALATLANNLSMIYQALGQLDRALEFQLKDVQILEQVMEKNHPDLALSYNNLCTIYYAMGQWDQALEFQYKTLEIYEQVLEKNHPDLAAAYNNLSLIYKTSGQLDQALKFQLKAVEIREQVLEENHPDTAQSYNNLAAIYKNSGRLDLAITYAQKAVSIMESLFPHGHPNLEIVRRNLEAIQKLKEK
jgi:tetratricopeptide (TPR) repeat protein